MTSHELANLILIKIGYDGHPDAVDEVAKIISESGAMPQPKPVMDEPFETFWKSYPRKVGKGAARKLFFRLRCDKYLDTILEAIEEQRKCEQWNDSGGRFIPHPATWLNQERWDDEMPETASTRSTLEIKSLTQADGVIKEAIREIQRIKDSSASYAWDGGIKSGMKPDFQQRIAELNDAISSTRNLKIGLT